MYKKFQEMAEIANTDGFKNQNESKAITYSDIAAKLLNDKFLLTALELHTELIECGREVKQLKDFFSNPGNFEIPWQDTSSRICMLLKEKKVIVKCDFSTLRKSGYFR